uniref:F-box-like family protein n=1 Tax=Pithovirus LCPAC001 TaxID=2506585 RepID=A0A481Z2G0_9VIRU|nr:MAG: F-box-like family protein [Pithovirus LCPAC001]
MDTIPVKPEFLEKVPKEVLRKILLKYNEPKEILKMCSTSKYLKNIVCDQLFITKVSNQYGMDNIKTLPKLDTKIKSIIKTIKDDLMLFYKYNDDNRSREIIFDYSDKDEDEGFILKISSIWYNEKEYMVVWMVEELGGLMVDNDFVKTGRVMLSRISFNKDFKGIVFDYGSYIVENIIDYVLPVDFNNLLEIKKEIMKDFKLNNLLLFSSDIKDEDGYFDYDEFIEMKYGEYF